jgi:arylsulfatase A-like enzyme
VVNGGTVNGVNLAGSAATCDATNSLGAAKVTDYTTCLPTVEAYDDTKVQALLNQIDGKTSDGAFPQAVPTVFGMNFQAVSVGQKLTPCGYADASGTPTACLADALAHTDASLGKLVAELEAKNLLASTLVIITAKHGQSPIDKSQVAMEIAALGNVTDPAGIISAADPGYSEGAPASGHLMADDVGIVWLQSGANVAAVVTQLQNNAAAIHADALPAGTVFTSSITSGAALAALYGDPTGADAVVAARAPDIFIQPKAGTIYSGSSKKRAEHGGGTVDDTAVALLVSRPTLAKVTVTTPVTTTQVAPTILKQLGLDPAKLQAVVKESTAVLPGL